jgi:type IV secretory pathway TrbF-like protein
MQRIREAGPVVQDAFYWLGVALACACIVLILARNPELVWQSNQTGIIPLSWIAGAASILAFLAAEYCDAAAPVGSETELSAEALKEA